VSCAVCEGQEFVRLKAVISPWIRDLGVTRKRLSTLLKCERCGFSAFNYKYTDEGMGFLYSDYRSFRYTAIRNRWEPWYDNHYNSGHESKAWLESRVAAIKEFMGDYDFSQTHLIDIGGDTGDIARRLGAASFEVRELSNRAEVSSNVKAGNRELSICTHVLEHVSDPIGFLKNLARSTSPVYLEVPAGIPLATRSRKSLFLQMVALCFSFSPRMWAALTSPATGRGNSIGLLRQSEHLTFWNSEHFALLEGRVNAKFTAKEGSILTPDGKTARIVQVLMNPM